MRWQDTAVVAGTALATAAVIVAIGWTAGAVAKEGETPEVKWPVLTVGEATVTLRLDKEVYRPGDVASVCLEVANASASPARIDGTIAVTVQDMKSMLSRRMELPKENWKQACAVSLEAGERRSFTFPTTVKLAAGNTIRARLAVGSQTVSTPPIVAPAPAEGTAS